MAYSYTYLGLVNRVLQDYNEVPLDSTTFASATGFQAYVKDYVNDALNDIYTWQDTEWPFLWTTKTFVTTIGSQAYSKDTALISIDWESFEIARPNLTATLTRSGTTVTATVAAGHQLVANDRVTIAGATQTEYNGDFTATIVSSTVFTYVISSSTATTPATGTITATPPYTNQFMGLKDYDEYRRDIRDIDINATVLRAYSPPRFVIRKPDNNFLISPPPDRIYTVQYEGFTNPTDLSLYTDVPLVPNLFKQVIIDRAGVYALAFRDNDQQLVRNDKKFEDNCHRMRRILIPQNPFMTFKD